MVCQDIHICPQLSKLSHIAPNMASFMIESLIVAIEHKEKLLDDNRGLPIVISGAYTHNQYVTMRDILNKQGYGDIDHATEYGAYGIACIFVEKYTEYNVINSSKKGTGIDFYLKRKTRVESSTDEFNFLSGIQAHDARLEVSGTQNKSSKKSRTTQKLEQAKKSNYLGTPYFVAVMDYETPELVLEYRE